MSETEAVLPADVDRHVSWFDRLASAVAAVVSRAYFFVVCVALILIWAPSRPLFPDVNTWQLVVNSGTTIITFLLVALLQNTTRRADQAVQHKLNAIAAALADLVDREADSARDIDQLRAAVGLEERESSS